MIVESLRSYPSPVFIYLPPHAELRGGAWVVIDPAINPDHMEFFCTPDTCRGGVLEPEGTCEIKYRTPDLMNTINRLDDECRSLFADIKARQVLIRPGVATSLASTAAAPAVTTKSSNSIPASEASGVVSVEELQTKLRERQQLLLPIYQQVSQKNSLTPL